MKRCETIPDPMERRLMALGIVFEALKPLDITPVLVGGMAVEMYSMGSYATFDADLLAPATRDVERVLVELGFERIGKTWKHRVLDLILEFVAGPFSVSWERVQPVEIGGHTIHVIGLEDIILDRVEAYVHWGDLSSREWAVNLMAAHYGDIDWTYCHHQASKRQCLDAFTEIQKYVKRNLARPPAKSLLRGDTQG